MGARCALVHGSDHAARSAALTAAARQLGVVGVESVEEGVLWFVREGTGFDPLTLLDPALETGRWVDEAERKEAPCGPDGRRAWVIETALLPGVTDPTAAALERAAALCGHPDVRAASGRRYVVHGPERSEEIELLVQRLLANPVIERWALGPVEPGFTDVPPDVAPLEHVAITGRTTPELLRLSHERGLSLDQEQLLAVQRWFADEGREPTDAELETIAQTWSEHCAHTTFRARITWDDGVEIPSLLAQLRDSTRAISTARGDGLVVSAFDGNAGIVHFGGPFDLALKAETHNHPSAVEPFGGANTGVGGVIRDIIGAAAEPVAVTDILCFGPHDLSPDALPAGVLHPSRIRSGVISGIGDYGNKIGLPTVAGAVLEDPGYTSNPLVFAGCIGIRPHGFTLPGAKPGDRVLALGGRTGRDGIRGATFSSRAMDATTAGIAGASVQIGDPIVERLLINLFEDLLPAGLITDVTDCGAGGFSSAIGEMASRLGADIDLDAAPRKYDGLARWEVWLSEAQERMVIAVNPAHVHAVGALCRAHDVEWCDLGAFRDDGRLVVRCGGETIVDLPGAFLHDGQPRRSLHATRPVTPPPTHTRRHVDDHAVVLRALLGHASLCSTEQVIRGYDHEIRGCTVGRPLVGPAADGAADAPVLLIDPHSLRRDATGAGAGAGAGVSGTDGYAIGIGVNARLGVLDAGAMAECVVDEAIRNTVAVGADPDMLCLLDNFSWGSPSRPSTLGQLADAVAGCVAAATRHRAPFVSGKDSLNNEYRVAAGSDRAGESHSIPPTLVITAVGHVPDVARRAQSDLPGAGLELLVVGATGDELRGSHLDAVLGIDGPGGIPRPTADAHDVHRAVHAVIRDGLCSTVHDVSEGGLAVALAEMAIAGRTGVDADLSPVAADPLVAAYSESCTRYVLAVSPEHLPAVAARLVGAVHHRIGRTTATGNVRLHHHGTLLVDVAVDDAVDAWKVGA